MFTDVLSKLAGFPGVRLALVAGLVLTPWFGAPAPPAAAGPGDPGAAAGTTITVNTNLDEVAPIDGTCSLREAISAANNHVASGLGLGECPAGSGTDTIVLPAGTYLLTRLGVEDANVSGDLDVVDSLILQGAGAATTIIDGNSATVHERVLHNLSGDLTLSGVTIRNGSETASAGGGIQAYGTLTLTDSIVRDNVADSGAGIMGVGALLLAGSQVYSNTAASDGGGIYAMGQLQLTGTGVSTNTAATGSGGGIYASQGLALSGGSVYSNVASSAGGGIYVALGALAVSDASIASNLATGGPGGGLFVQSIPGTLLVVDHAVITGNQASADGGGMFVAMGTLRLTHSSVTSNTSGSSGGGLATFGTFETAQLADVTLSHNQAVLQGGGLFSGIGVNFQGGTVSDNRVSNGPGGGLFVLFALPGVGLRLTGVTISDNTAAGPDGDGGGVYSIALTELHFSTLSTNHADGSGGGLYAELSATIEDSTIRTNVADGSGVPGDGGGVWCADRLAINNTAISDNQANGIAGGGGGIYAAAAATLTNMTVSGNKANGSGGGAYLGGTAPVTRTLNSVTIAGNVANADTAGVGDQGGGLYVVTGTVQIKNTLLAGNLLAAAASDCFRASGTLTSQDYNLIQTPDASCSLAAAHDQAGVDPLLLALADNGGTTQTRALGAGSPALNAIPNGTNSCGISPLDKDQRGFPRPQPAGGQCDVGACEDQPPAFTSLPLLVAHPTLTYTYQVSTTDLDLLDTRAISAPVEPAWLALTDHGDGSATLQGTPAFTNTGTYSVSLLVQDSTGLTGTQDFVIAVSAAFGYIPVVIR